MDIEQRAQASSYQYIQSRAHTYWYLFFVRTITIWNQLSNSVVQASLVCQYQALAITALRDMQPTDTHSKL